MVNLFIGSFHFYSGKYKEKTSNTYSALYSMGSCPFSYSCYFSSHIQNACYSDKIAIANNVAQIKDIKIYITYKTIENTIAHYVPIVVFRFVYFTRDAY